MGRLDDGERERLGLLEELFGRPGAIPPAGESLRGRLLRTREVAALFQVSARAVTDWAAKGRLPSVRTPGGHRRYPADRVRTLLEATGVGKGAGRYGVGEGVPAGWHGVGEGAPAGRHNRDRTTVG